VTATANDSSLVNKLEDIVGQRFVMKRESDLLVYNSDGLPGYRRMPRIAVFPGNREEAVAVVRLLAEEKLPFVPRGAGTGLSGGALADGVVLLGMHRLKRIISIDRDNLRAVVEPGVVNLHLNRTVAQLGLLYAPDPSSEAACTIGGNIAENAGGPHCLKYGVTLNHVIAMTVILPDGEIVTLGNAEGEAAGYDLSGAFLGSEGCGGIALDITVRLTGKPAAVRTMLADFTSVDDAAHVTSAIIASGIVPAALEFMDAPTIQVV
jgi:FAD/FMN-containing dehydrogenase